MNNTAGITPEANRWFHRARQLQKEQLRQLAQQGTLASRISALVHMLQCERGASNLWLCSAGRLYAAECRAGSALVDEQLIAFREALEVVRECASGALCWWGRSGRDRAIGSLLAWHEVRVIPGIAFGATGEGKKR